jgi:precorrin-4/cobalt-precorrin-4 C11-methyltransferase
MTNSRSSQSRAPNPQPGKVAFIGAGPGDPELLTLKGRRLIEAADLVLYADSLVSPEVCGLARPGAPIIGTADQTLETIIEMMLVACRAGQNVARVHSGDPSLYGALHEQLVALEREGIDYEIVPGVSSAFAAAAALRAELTVPEVAQTVIFTRLPSRTKGVPTERLRDLAAHGVTMAIFLSVTAIDRVVAELRAGGYPDDTPVVVAYRVSWPDEVTLRCRLDEVEAVCKERKLWRQTLFLVGPALAAAGTRSHLYHSGHFHTFRKPDPAARRALKAAKTAGATEPR